MHSKFFEVDGNRLYAVIQEPVGGYVADFAVLMCYPFGEEYMRGHHAFRQLANLLAQKGVVSLRFDYAGTGDSSGDAQEFLLSTAMRQIRSIAGELRNLAGVDDVKAVGLRLGASLAYAGLNDVDYVKQIALWDPVISGSHYLREMRKTIPPDRENEYLFDSTWWIQGFPVPERLRNELEAVDLCKLNCLCFNRILHLSSEESPQGDQLRTICEAEHRAYTYEMAVNHNSGGWITEDMGGSYLFANQVYSNLVSWLTDK